VEVGEAICPICHPRVVVVWVEHLGGVASHGNGGDIVGKRMEGTSCGVEARKAVVTRSEAGGEALVVRILVDRPPLVTSHNDRLGSVVVVEQG